MATEFDNPNGRKLSTFERNLTADIADSFKRMLTGLFRGVNDGNVQHLVNQRIQSHDYWQPLQDVLVRHLQLIAGDGAEFGRSQVERSIFGVRKASPDFNINWDLANENAATWAIEWGTELVGIFAKNTTPRIQKEIANYIRNKETIGQLVKRIRADGWLYSERRARTIAVTEVTRAYARGNIEAWKASGLDLRKRWRTNHDELVCQICGPLAELVSNLSGEFPGGYDAPPAHPDCRCWVTPVVEVPKL